jgi:DNA mismatch endonuclease (patch repair protein)
MKANRATETSPEVALRRALRRTGLPGYRKNWRGVPGRPDIAYPGRRVAVFVHGCFWHRCPRCDLPLPRTNADFWRRKFERNRERDRRKVRRLEDTGWRVFVFWECEVNEDAGACARTVVEYIMRGA